MRLVFTFLLFIAFSASAEVYKWTDADGNIHFGNQPPPGEREEVRIRDSSPGAMGSSRKYQESESDIIRQSQELERRKQQQAIENSKRRYSERVDEIRSDYDNRADYICKGAENRLKNAEERWESNKLQGYSVREEQYHKRQIKEAKRHRDNICR